MPNTVRWIKGRMQLRNPTVPWQRWPHKHPGVRSQDVLGLASLGDAEEVQEDPRWASQSSCGWCASPTRMESLGLEDVLRAHSPSSIQYILKLRAKTYLPWSMSGAKPAHSRCNTDICWEMKAGGQQGWAEVRKSIWSRRNNMHKSTDALKNRGWIADNKVWLLRRSAYRGQRGARCWRRPSAKGLACTMQTPGSQKDSGKAVSFRHLTLKTAWRMGWRGKTGFCSAMAIKWWQRMDKSGYLRGGTPKSLDIY